MRAAVPRLRMFAGPNGSGKSTIKTLLPERLLATYINPDEIEKFTVSTGQIDLASFGVTATTQEVSNFFAESVLLERSNLTRVADSVSMTGSILHFGNREINSYVASVTADFIRQRLLDYRQSFSFETVMSSEDKVKLLSRAQSLGYRTYLYYVATADPEINVERVRIRARMGGHDVPLEKIRSRYKRSLALLFEAIKFSNRAYVWDNSGGLADLRWIAEITDGNTLELKTDAVPAWFKAAVLDKVDEPS